MNKPTKLFSALACATLLFSSGCKKRPTPTAKPAAAAPAVVHVPAALDVNKLPAFVDRDLFRAFTTALQRCQVDTVRSEVTSCRADYLDNIATLYRRGFTPRHTAMQTAAYVFEHGDLALKTVAADFLFRALRSPSGTLPDKDVITKLIAQLGTLPWAQAADAAPAITHVALRAKLENELFAALDAASDKRVTAAGYRHAMEEGRMTVFPRVWQLAASENLELALAAVEAPRLMGGRTVEENKKICDWMKEIVTSGRPMLETRAAAFLTGCGPSYLDMVLSLDEKRWSQREALLGGGLATYGNVCRVGEKNPYGTPTKSQCARLKKLATAIVTDTSTREGERVQALNVLAEQFPGKDTLALAGRFANERQTTALARRAQTAMRDLGGAPPPDHVD